MQATFDNTVSILVKAFLQGKLQHGSCTACAVGNLVTAARPELKRVNSRIWALADGRNLDGMDWYQTVRRDFEEVTEAVYTRGIEQLECTGYSLEQITQIEAAFEFRAVDKEKRFSFFSMEESEKQYNGLMAVVDVLAEIHNIDLTTAEAAKLLFVKA